MQDYTAPIEDILFVINNLTSTIENKNEEYSDPELIKQIFEESGKLASNVLAPLNSTGDKEGLSLENGEVKMPNGFVDAYDQYVNSL